MRLSCHPACGASLSCLLTCMPILTAAAGDPADPVVAGGLAVGPAVAAASAG